MEAYKHIFVQKTGKFFQATFHRKTSALCYDCNDASNLINLQYLKQKTADFTEGEKAVTLLIDKYIQHNV